MKSRKKLWVVGLACLVIFGITVPVIASNVQSQSVRLEKEQGSQNTELNQTKAVIVGQAVQTVSKKSEAAVNLQENSVDVVDLTETAVDTGTAAVCPYYTDVNGDGLCDHCVHNGGCNNYTDVNGDGLCDYCTGLCAYYVDDNGDGVCDHCAGGTGTCAYYVDDNGDGVCDHCAGGTGTCAYYVDDNGDGVCDHCAGGTGTCAYYVDDNGDGVCDHCIGSGTGTGNGNGHHGDRHHSGGRRYHH